MTLQKIIPFVLLIFTVLCALPLAGDALNDNEQGGVNDADLNLDQDVTIDENHASVFGDDTAELDNTNVAEPLGVPVNIQEEESVLVEEKTLAPTQTPTPPT